MDCSTDPVEAFDSTVAHALRLHQKARMLDAQVRDSLEVAASIVLSRGVPSEVIAQAVIALTEEGVTGRGQLPILNKAGRW